MEGLRQLFGLAIGLGLDLQLFPELFVFIVEPLALCLDVVVLALNGLQGALVLQPHVLEVLRRGAIVAVAIVGVGLGYLVLLLELVVGVVQLLVLLLEVPVVGQQLGVVLLLLL